jgi:hypothetical protein
VQTPINIYIDIWTNKGGQGLSQYGGSYNLGDRISVYITSRTGGYAEVSLCYQSIGEHCNEYDSGYLAARDKVELQDTVKPPSGKQYFILHVCQIAGGSLLTCPSDYTWIDVSGQTTVQTTAQTTSSTNPSHPTYTTNTMFSSFTSATFQNSANSSTSENQPSHSQINIPSYLFALFVLIVIAVLVLLSRSRRHRVKDDTRVY